jgi:hypothetical protein
VLVVPQALFASFKPIAAMILAAGQNPVKPIWNKLAPTKAVSHSQLTWPRLI